MIARRIVATSRGQIHVRTMEGSGPPVLLLHMSPSSSDMYTDFMQQLGRTAAAPDRLGFGCSDPPPGQLSMDEYAAATLEVVDALGWQEPFDVVGTHTGSVEAVAIAHLAAERVRKVLIVAAPVYTEAEKQQRLAAKGVPRSLPTEDGSHLLEVWRRRLAWREPPYDLDLMHRRTAQELVATAPHMAYRAVFTFPMMERLRTMPVPIVVLNPHDDLVDHTRRVEAILPADGSFVEAPDLALDLFMATPERMVEVVRTHLEGHEE